MLWSRHRRRKALRFRRKGLPIRLLPLSLLILRRPLLVELLELFRVHGSFTLVGVKDQVDGEIHQEVGGGTLMKVSVVVLGKSRVE